MKNVVSLLDLRFAQGIIGIPFGQIKVVRGETDTGEQDYAIFADDEYIGSIPDITSDQQAIQVGIERIQGSIQAGIKRAEEIRKEKLN